MTTINTSYADDVWNTLAFLIRIPAVVDRYENEKARKQKYIDQKWRELARKPYLKSKAVTK